MLSAGLFMLLFNTAEADVALAARDIYGNIVEIGDTQDKIIMLNFWATWCSPCMAEMPHLQKLKDKYAEDLLFISISVDEARDASKLKPFLRRGGYDFTVIHDADRSITALYNPQMVLPYNVIIGYDGNVIWQGAGYEPGKELVFDKILSKVIKE